jgi:hypothetical protein
MIDNLFVFDINDNDDGEIVDAMILASEKTKLAIKCAKAMHAGMYAEVAAHCANELVRRLPDIHFVSLNRTENYNIEPEDQPFIEAILDVYSYASNHVTYCCEMTPSYWLTSHGSIVRFKEEADGVLSDIAQERIHERILSRYEGIVDESGGVYIHCHNLDALRVTLEAANDFRYYHLGFPPATRADYDTDADFENAVEEWTREAYNTGATSIS